MNTLLKYFLAIFSVFYIVDSLSDKYVFNKKVSLKMNSDIASEAIVIGAGPAGLTTALMLAQRGFRKVKVYERLEEYIPPGDSAYWSNFEASRAYNVGLNGRGQNVLKPLGVLYSLIIQ